MEKHEIVLKGTQLTKVFPNGRSVFTAVDHVDFTFHRGEIISIVGESGSGKSALAKMVLGLHKISSGEIEFDGKPRNIRSRRKCIEYWHNVQAIFQDPFSSFNIFRRIDELLLDCLRFRGDGRLSDAEKNEQMKIACSFVNLKFEEMSGKYPFELSGGQMQRLMIARIFLLHPRVLIADEPTSMIDACSRATILEMLLRLREEEQLTIVFITHDIGLAYSISDRIYIMEHGRFVEEGEPDEVILHPKQEYTRHLLNDVPKIQSKWDFSENSVSNGDQISSH